MERPEPKRIEQPQATRDGMVLPLDRHPIRRLPRSACQAPSGHRTARPARSPTRSRRRPAPRYQVSVTSLCRQPPRAASRRSLPPVSSTDRVCRAHRCFSLIREDGIGRPKRTGDTFSRHVGRRNARAVRRGPPGFAGRGERVLRAVRPQVASDHPAPAGASTAGRGGVARHPPDGAVPSRSSGSTRWSTAMP